MWNKLSYIKQNLVVAIPIAMIIGVFFGYFFNPIFLKSFILPLTIMMIYPMMVTLNMKTVFSSCCKKTQTIIQFVNFIIIPVIGYSLGLIFFKESPFLAYGLLLMALLPTSGMTISWTGFAKGNVNVAIKATIIGLILGSLLMPFYTKFFMGTVINLPLAATFTQLAKVIFLPLILGYITQVILKKKYGNAHFQKDIKKKFPLLSTLAVLGIIFVAISLKSKSIISNPLSIAYLLIPITIFYLLNYTISSIVGRFLLPRAKAIALVYGTVMRNLSVALAIALTVFGENGIEIALIIAVAYVVQVQSAAWYIKLSNKIFGTAPEDKARDIMESGVFALHNSSTINDAIKMLDEEHIHSLVVLGDKDKILGVLTSETIINVLAENFKINTKLSDINLHPVIQCQETAPIKKVINTMKRKHEYKVVVTDSHGNMKGVLTESDIINRLSTRGK